MGVVFLFVVAILESFTGETRTVEVYVIGKAYEGGKTNVGYTSAGDGGVVVTSSSAKYSMIIEFKDETRALVKTDKETYIYIDPNMFHDLSCYYGGLSEEVLRCVYE